MAKISAKEPLKIGAALKPHAEGTLLLCRVAPSSSKNMIASVSERALKVRVTSAPVDGKANKSVIALLSKTFKIPKKRVIIVRGETGKTKTILLVGINAKEAEKKLSEVL